MVIEHHGKKPKIHPDAFVAETAVVIGDVTIGKDSSIWYGAVLRGDINSITIGERTSIQDNCVVHVDEDKPVVVGDDVTVGHGVILHGCKIGNKVLVGMGAVILDGAEIGDGAIVAAGAVVKEGQVSATFNPCGRSSGTTQEKTRRKCPRSPQGTRRKILQIRKNIQ